MKCFVFFMVTALMVAVPVRKTCGQVSQASEAVAESLINVMLRESGQAAANELIEFGGEAAVRELIERAAREGGESLVDRIVQYGSSYGPSALIAIEPSPSRMVRAFDRLPPDLIQPSIRAAAREPKLLSRLVSAYGNAALKGAARQPGVGAALVEKLGLDGIRIGNHLTTDQAVALARVADEIAALPSAERSQLLEAILKAPAQVLDFLEAHPKVLLTAGGVSAFIASKENILGSAGQPGGHETARAGLIERVVYRLTDKVTSPVMAAILFTFVSICAYLITKFWVMAKFIADRRNRSPNRGVPDTRPPVKSTH